LRQVCTNQIGRGIQDLSAEEPNGSDSNFAVSKVFVQVTAPKRVGSSDAVTDLLLKRLQSRAGAKAILDAPCLSLKVITTSLKRTSVVSTAKLYSEVLDIVKQVVEGPLAVEFLAMEVAPSSQPQSFSQISPQILKQLPRDVVRDLKRQFGRSITANDESEVQPLEERPAIPRSLSQLDPATLDELPADVRNEIEESLKRTSTPPEAKGRPFLPTSASQIDESVLAELPLEIRQSIERNFARKPKNKKVRIQQEEEEGASRHSVFDPESRAAYDEDFIEDGTSRSSFPESFSQIDLATLRELPKDVADQIEREYRMREGPKIKPRSVPKGTLDGFIGKRKASRQTHTNVSFAPGTNGDLTDGAQQLAFQPFNAVAATVTGFVESMNGTCPHEGGYVLESLISYSRALLHAMELDKLVMLVSLLRRLCRNRECLAHGGTSECWRLVCSDAVRRIDRLHQELFNGARLALELHW
jgi:hypothetical protein